MWKFYFMLSSGFIDGYSCLSLETCIDCRNSCLQDSSIIKVSNIFYDDNFGED